MKLLIVRLRLIGDVVFTTPLIRALRRRYPDAHLTYLVESAAAAVVSGNPHLNEVVTVAHTHGWRRVTDDLKLARRLRRDRFDIAIDLHGGPRSAWLTWATRAPVRVGYDVAGRSWMYTTAVHRPRGLRPRHSVVNQWDVLAALDQAWPAPDAEHDPVEMTVDPAAARSISRRLSGWGVIDGARIIVLHVSAGNPFRRWPESAFAELAAAVVQSEAHRWVLVTSGPSDHEAAARVVDAARQHAPLAAPRIVDAEGLSLPELRALFDRTALFIGGDSGPLHVAATSRAPIVGLYGPTLPERSAPWRPASVATASVDAGTLPCRPCEQRRCEPGDFRCLTGIPSAKVIAEAERLLELTR